MWYYDSKLCGPGALDQLGQSNVRGVELVASNKGQDSDTAEGPDNSLVGPLANVARVQVISDHGIEAHMAMDWDNNSQESIGNGVSSVDGRGGKQGNHRDSQETLKVPVVRSMDLVRGDGLVRDSLVGCGHFVRGLTGSRGSAASYSLSIVKGDEGTSRKDKYE